MKETYQYQKELPILPIPELNITLQKLLEWSAPLLTQQEQEQTKKAVDEFLKPNGDGERLQHSLVDWSIHHGLSNWSSPVWKNIYLESRDSLTINSNVFYYLKSKLDEIQHSQAHIATALIVSVYKFIAMVDQKTLTIDMQKEWPLCMNQYDNLFSSIRSPRLKTDEFKVSSSRKHIVVMHAQHLYKINIIDEEGDIRSPSSIKAEINCILCHSENGQNIGLLTTLPRDIWANSHTDLVQLSTNNRDAMTAIEEAAFALCLDENAPKEITDISKQLLHGSGRDRFFDKSLQFIVFKNGKTGINFEHTSVDGSVMLRLISHIYDSIDTVCFDTKHHDTEATETRPHKAEEITFDLNDALLKNIKTAEDFFNQHIANTQTRILNFKHFGKDLIKEFRVSPDAFVQLALQLAEHKLYGQCYSAYEAVMTRSFLDGRIDVLYTVSPESTAFIQHIRSGTSDNETTKNALILATQKHIERANECRFGQGIYTHLLALKYCYKMNGNDIGISKLPKIFSNKGYLALTNSVVCTSTTSQYGVELAGYGPIVDNGYGIRYFIRNNAICFNMTSRTKMQDKLEQMRRYIEQSLLEMSELMRH